MGGETELLLGMGITGTLNFIAGFGKSEFHIGQGWWKAATRNKKNPWVSPPSPTARMCENVEAYYPKSKIAIYDLEFLATRADVGDISEVKKLSVYRQDRRKNRTNSIENAICQLRDTFPGYRT